MRCWRCRTEHNRARCPKCGAWATVAEPGGALQDHEALHPNPQPLTEVPCLNRTAYVRMPLETVWPEGVPPGAVLLLGGAPGAGKSTLALQLAAALAARNVVLYVTAEEQLAQLRARADRLGVVTGRLYVLSEHNLARVLRAAENLQAAVLVLDSVQMLTPRASDVPGSPATIREVAAELVRWAQRTGTVVIAVSQAPKRGGFAGPRLLEHIVDVALYLEPAGSNGHRILRVEKNRYGPTTTLIFVMTPHGLCPSAPVGHSLP